MVNEQQNLNLEVLDNPIWNALCTRHHSLASCDDLNLVRLYPRDMLPMAGLKNFEPEAISSFCSMLESKRRIGLCVPVAPVLPPELKVVMQFDTAQMIRQIPPFEFSSICVEPIIELENKDIEQMQTLADLTRPGPFTSRTIQFGKFYGIKIGDRLVAMTGQRMSMQTTLQNEICILTEVSGVCTHPDFQGRGYAKALVHQASLGIESRGEIPFLHVLASNNSAIKSYTACGFTQRRIMQYLIVEKI
ncbi:MAG: GNAT family N-acetyltransferase [Candidatus Melainabacteria bacterium]|nr:GNAT family N-acetyltransferase [Candidatus Melainabacteria bacterium]